MFSFRKWREWAARLKRQTYALYLAYKDPRVPWYTKLCAALVVAYALSPIDLIPDFIPVLGYLDDLILIPLGIALVVKMIPEEIMQECEAKAQSEMMLRKRGNWAARAVVILTWLFLFFFVAVVVIRKVAR
jgi:uncharacterized membrane protein YkvA (DUF1232 family)